MATAADTFVEGSTVALESHTPTGPDAGSGWVSFLGNINVDATSDVATDANDASSNRYVMNNDLGSPDMVVEAVFTSASGTLLAPGIPFRRSSSGSGGYEAGYDFSLGQWVIEDGVTNSTLTESWPGGSVTLRVETTGRFSQLYVNNIVKVSLESSVEASGNYAGIRLLNFDGTGTGKLTADNYRSFNRLRFILG